MAPFKNLFGEISPDQMRVRVFVRTKGGDVTITKVEGENSKGEMEDISLSAILNSFVVTPGAQMLNLISPNIDAQPGNFDAAVSINRIPHEVVYMDVGRWGGPTSLAGRQRNFGLVWGTWAAICDFEPGTPVMTPAEEFLRDEQGAVRPDHPINEFISNVRAAGSSVRVLRSMFSANPNYLKGFKHDFATLYVILPDLHLPVTVTKPPPPDGNHMGRVDYRQATSQFPIEADDGVMPNSNPTAFGEGATRWFNNYLAGDIFGGPNSPGAVDLNRFLAIIENISLRDNRKLHFVQIGDMYDYWIGLSRFFSKQPGHDVVLANGTGENNGILAGSFIDFWTDRTNVTQQSGTNPNCVERLNKLAAHPRHKTSWLFGNHDNYLAAHTPVIKVGTGVPARVRKVHTDGVLIEHGQRGDPDNRDGATNGHSTTNRVFALKQLRALDPNRRNFFTAMAGATYVGNPDFHMFVMGHTHSPFLTRLRIEVVLVK